MPKDQLLEEFFHQNMLLFRAHCELKRKKELHNQEFNSLMRMNTVLNYEIVEFNQQRAQLNALTFELMLHTSCYKFAKLSRLLDL